MKQPFKNPELAALFESYPPQLRTKLLALRDLIFETAAQTNLISTFREIYPREFKYQGNRAIILNANEDIPVKPLKHCILLALTYFLQK